MKTPCGKTRSRDRPYWTPGALKDHIRQCPQCQQVIAEQEGRACPLHPENQDVYLTIAQELGGPSGIL